MFSKLNVNDRSAFKSRHATAMNHRLIMLDVTEAGGQKVLGPSMIIRVQTATIWAFLPTNKSNEDGR